MLYCAWYCAWYDAALLAAFTEEEPTLEGNLRSYFRTEANLFSRFAAQQAEGVDFFQSYVIDDVCSRKSGVAPETVAR